MALILVVDDDQQNRYLLEALLSGNGHEVLSAANGEEALALAGSRPVNLIISDILMPVKDGFALCREWNAHEKLFKIPFVFYSATYTGREDIDFGLSLGADLFLIKPMDPTDLMAALEELLKRKATKEGRPLKTCRDRIYLQGYNQALVKKLEKKMLQLEAEVESRRKTEVQLLRFKTAMENAGESMLMMSAEGIVEYVNPAFEQIIGFSKEEILGHRLTPHDQEGENLGATEEVLNAVQKGQVWRGHLAGRTKDKKAIELDVTVSPIPGREGESGGHVAILRDVTQQMIMETKFSQSQKMEAIGTLAGGIAHDFNNILGVVIGNAELSLDLIKNNQNPEEKIDRILMAGTRAGKLVKQILNFSRQTEQEMKPISLCRAVKETLEFIRSSLPATIEIRHDLKEQTDIIMADPIQVQQVLMNLFTNSGHAMARTGGTLTVGLETVELGRDDYFDYPDLAPGRYQRLTVSDTGQGMDKETLAKIFDPFFTTKEVGEGTGLGLSVVHGIIKSHGGAITVYSEPGVGSTFNVYLPLSGKDARLQKPAPDLPLPRGEETILFVDDEQALAEIGREILAGYGYRVTSLTSSPEALELFQNNPGGFDLIITDHIMPHFTGLELARKLMDIKPDLPVILCSGFRDNRLAEEAAGYGIKRVLTKPFRKSELLQTVRQILDA